MLGHLAGTIMLQLTADYSGTSGWDDNAATFELIIVSNNIHEDYQFANGYGHDVAEKVLKFPYSSHQETYMQSSGHIIYVASYLHLSLHEHRNNFITRQDFNFLYMHGINTVRVPVGRWVAYDPCPSPLMLGEIWKRLSMHSHGRDLIMGWNIVQVVMGLQAGLHQTMSPTH